MGRGRENPSMLTFSKKKKEMISHLNEMWWIFMTKHEKNVRYLWYTFAISESCSSTIKAVACVAFKDDCFMPLTAINVR